MWGKYTQWIKKLDSRHNALIYTYLLFFIIKYISFYLGILISKSNPRHNVESHLGVKYWLSFIVISACSSIRETILAIYSFSPPIDSL